MAYTSLYVKKIKVDFQNPTLPHIIGEHTREKLIQAHRKLCDRASSIPLKTDSGMHGHPTLVIYNQYYLFQTGTEWVVPHNLVDYPPSRPDGCISSDITMKHEFFDK